MNKTQTIDFSFNKYNEKKIEPSNSDQALYQHIWNRPESSMTHQTQTVSRNRKYTF